MNRSEASSSKAAWKAFWERQGDAPLIHRCPTTIQPPPGLAHRFPPRRCLLMSNHERPECLFEMCGWCDDSGRMSRAQAGGITSWITLAGRPERKVNKRGRPWVGVACSVCGRRPTRWTLFVANVSLLFSRERVQWVRWL